MFEKNNDLTFNNDDLRRPKMGLIFISSLKKETIKFVFILEDMMLSIVNVWKKNNLTITSAINSKLFFTLLREVAMYNLFTSLASFKQYLVTFSKTTYLVEALIHRYMYFFSSNASNVALSR